MIRCRLAVCVLALAFCVSPARAGVVGYFFIEASDGSHPGTAGAFLAFDSPPAEPGSGWTISNVADIVDFRVFDSALAPVGVYMPQLITSSVGSNTGATLDSGQMLGGMPPQGAIETAFDPSSGGSLLANPLTGASSHGDWRLALTLAVPEPSSMVMATMAATAGAVLSMRMLKRSYAKQPPVTRLGL
jgi:hypothetical protein